MRALLLSLLLLGACAQRVEVFVDVDGEAPIFSWDGENMADLTVVAQDQNLTGDTDGTLMWSAGWDDPDPAKGGGIFIDYSLVLERGVTRINGLVIESFGNFSGYNFCLSPNGRYLLFRATLQGGVDGAYLLDLWQ